jgi:hypothetical protein
MPKGLALLLFVLFATSCPAQPAALPSWGSDAVKAWWAKNPTPDLWPQAADALRSQLEADYKQNGARVYSDTDFRGWLEHLEWVRLGLDCPEDLAGADQLKIFVALGQDEAVSHLFVEKIDPRDVKNAALKNLLRLAADNADDLHEYASLGVAFSLVFDEPFPKGWPHRQVDPKAVPTGDPDMLDRFHFYVQSNRNKKLDLDPTQLSFENLKFLVDSEISLTELAYAQGNRISYSHFSDAFFSIVYDQKRIGNATAVYDWPYPSYQLAEIEKRGGICIDQAYYAETVGKGRGIPTIRFTGYGMDGAHAWFGYLSNSGKWELDCGRYEEQDFPKGFAVDPQTWQAIDDSVLENLFKNGGKNPNYPVVMTALAWAHLHEGDPAYADLLDDARAVMPEWSGTWRLQADLVDKGGDLDKIKAFYQDWITQFTSYPDLKVEGQKRLYLALKAANDPDADGLLKDIIIQNRSAGFDLGIEAGADALNEKIKAQDWDAARLVYEQTIRDFGQEGGLTLYVKVVYPWVQTCLQNNQLDLADRAIAFTEERMTIDKGSQLGGDFSELKNKVAAKKLATH